MIISGIIAVCIVIVLIMGKGYEKELLSKREKKGGLPRFLLSGGLFAYDRIRKLAPEKGEMLQMERALLITRAEKRQKAAETAGLSLLVIFFGSILCFFMAFEAGRKEKVTTVARPAFGEDLSEKYLVRGLSDTEEVSVSISGRVPEGNGMEAVFDQEYEALLPVILADNADFSHVETALVFQKESARGLRVLYRSSVPELISSYGNVYTEELPEQGADVKIFITLTYAEESREYILPVHIEKKAERELSEKERLEQLLAEMDRDSLGEESLLLPEAFEDQAIQFEEKETSPYAALALAVLFALCLFLLPGERLKARMKRRDEELRRSYPNLLSKLGTLISAGMSTYSAWMRVVKDYEDGLKEGRRKPEFAYEEMKITSYEIRSGTAEDQAYAAYGKRCGLHTYIKFGNMLGQNIRQGISGLTEALREEMSKALEERKNEALRLGEVAGTRLLFPMLMMLGVVIVSLIVPAFLSF